MSQHLFFARESVIIPANGMHIALVPASEFVRVIACPSEGVKMLLPGETKMEVYAGLRFKKDAGNTFEKIVFFNETAVPVAVKFYYGAGDIEDSSLYILDPLASAIVIRNADQVETIEAMSAPISSGDAALFVPANENTAYVEISVTDDSPAVYVGGLAALAAGAGRLIKPGETGRFDTKAALYVRSSDASNPSIVSGLRFFF